MGLIETVVMGAVLAATVIARSPAQEVSAQREVTLGRICGHLRRTEEVPLKGKAGLLERKEKALSRTALRLYERSDAPCCSGGALEETVTGRWGGFRFKKLKSGSFWLVANVDGKDYKMPILLKSAHPSTCSEQWFDIEKSGRFAFGVTITLD